jgi:MoaA/NifB/PqqE/SkfB family radical SAM enzyme
MRAFPTSTIAQLDKITFCGDVGDPIYCKDLISIVRYIKTANMFTTVEIVTNGSYKDTTWWKQLGSVLTDRDTVTFSVDGWDQASNEQYRVNSNFESIENGMRTLRANSNCLMTWSFIYFLFNENHVDKAKALASDIGFDMFTTVRSTKFDGPYLTNGIDPLKPISTQQIKSQTGIFKLDYTILNRMQFHATESMDPPHPHPWAKCLNHKKDLFVNVEGLVFPCPWFNNAYHENSFVQKYKEQINVKTRPFLEILADPLWGELVTMLEVMPMEICKMKCMP